jgi:sugar lactone lactonase YvrE
MRIAVAATFAALLAYLSLWPVPIAPVAWTPSPATRIEENDRLAAAARIGAELEGPEDIAFDRDGRLLTGLADGRIVRMSGQGTDLEVLARTGGRPLGMVFDPEGRLVVADAHRGLIRVGARGEVETLLTEAAGRPLRFPDDLDVAQDGTVYFSDASARFGIESFILDLLEHSGTGRLVAYEPRTGAARILLDGLQFTNGVALAPDESYVLVCETWAYRIRRYWLKGPRSGASDVWAENLPGLPDNINRGPDGLFWVALTPRLASIDAMASWPFLRKVQLRLPRRFHPSPPSAVLVVALDANGRIVQVLEDRTGKAPQATSAMWRGDTLYIGTAMGRGIAVLRPTS